MIENEGKIEEINKDQLIKKLQENNELIIKQHNIIEAQDVTIKNLKLELSTLNRYIFGSKKEKIEIVESNQLSLFDVQEENKTEEEINQEILSDAEKRVLKNSVSKKDRSNRAGIKRAYAKNVEVTIVNHTKEDDQNCNICDSELKPIGKKFIRQEIKYHCAHIEVIQHYTTVYKCVNCGTNDSSEEKSNIVKASMPKPVLTHTFASPSLLAQVMYLKYCLGVPLYRQEKSWDEKGLVLPRNVSSNWIIKVCDYYLAPLVSLMLKKLKENCNLLHMDETTIQCNKEEGRKASTNSYMWVLASGKDESTKAFIFTYDKSRSAKVALELLADFRATLVTDGYVVYKNIEGIVHAECWSHARRYFYESIPMIKNKQDVTSEGYKGVCYCNKIFELERELAELSNEDRQTQRMLKIKPIVNKFFEWVEGLYESTIFNNKLNKAVTYVKNQKAELIEFLNDGKIPITNNLAERSIRPFAVHRKNWLFADSVDGAKANATMYSIVETAKANNLNIYNYLEYLLAELPQIECIDDEANLESFLPWSEKLPDKVKNMNDAIVDLGDKSDNKLFV